MKRRAVTILEVLVATAILGAVMLAAYTWLEQDFRFGHDLVGRETADTLVRNLLERYRHLPPEVMLRLVGEEGEVDPGELGDATLDGVDPRGSDELERLGHRRGIRVWRQGGPLGGVGLSGRATWRSVDGDLDQFEFGVAQLQAGGAGAEEGGWGPRGRPSGFRRRGGGSDWGTRSGWSVPGGPRGAGAVSPEGAATGTGASGGGRGSGRSGGGAPAGGDRHVAEVWGGPGLEELIRKAAEGATVTDASAPPPPTRVAEVRDEREWLGRLTGEDGDLARSYREALERLRRRTPESREAEFVTRSTAHAGSGLVSKRVPPGRYHYVVDVLDVRHELAPRRVGSFQLSGDGGRFRMVLRELGAPPRRTLEGDEVLESRDLSGPGGRPWKLWRTPERLVLVEYPAGFFPAQLVLRELPAPDPSEKGTTMTRRAVEEALAAEHLGPVAQPHPSLLQVAAARSGGF